jgi:hypothetical protein
MGYTMKFSVLLVCGCALGLLFAGGGCATLVTGGGQDQAVRISSNPRGADVYVDDQPMGKTPLSLRLSRKDDHFVRVEKEGYRPYEKQLKSGFNPWMIGNVLFGGIVGIVIDAVSGTNPSLSNSDVNAKLVADTVDDDDAPAREVYSSRHSRTVDAAASYRESSAHASPTPPPASYAPYSSGTTYTGTTYTGTSPSAAPPAYNPPSYPAPAPYQPPAPWPARPSLNPPATYPPQPVRAADRPAPAQR